MLSKYKSKILTPQKLKSLINKNRPDSFPLSLVIFSIIVSLFYHSYYYCIFPMIKSCSPYLYKSFYLVLLNIFKQYWGLEKGFYGFPHTFWLGLFYFLPSFSPFTIPSSPAPMLLVLSGDLDCFQFPCGYVYVFLWVHFIT